MSNERVVVRQNSQFEISVLASDPHHPDDLSLHPVAAIHQLTPYGMLLASLGTCTAIVLHTYAQHHGVSLDEVELRLGYDRVFAEDCESCDKIAEYEEQVTLEIVLTGDLTPELRQRLYAVSKHCPIHKMLAHRIEVRSYLAEAAEGET